MKVKAKLQTRNPSNVLSIPQHIPLKPDTFSDNMGLLNIDTFTTKTSVINDFISKLFFLFLVETWLTSDSEAVLVETCPLNYNFFHSIRQGKQGGRTQLTHDQTATLPISRHLVMGTLPSGNFVATSPRRCLQEVAIK